MNIETIVLRGYEILYFCKKEQFSSYSSRILMFNLIVLLR